MHDRVNRLGGYPSEVAKPEVVFTFYQDKGFSLEGLKSCGDGLCCNEFALRQQ